MIKASRRDLLSLAAAAATLPRLSRAAWALDYPARPVRLIVATGAGGSPDIVARLIGQWLSEKLGQSFVVENRPGASTNIGTELALKAAPDGGTLLFAMSSSAINPALYRHLNFNFVRDAEPVASIARIPLRRRLLLHYRFRQAAFRLRVETEMIASPSVPTQPAHPRSAYEGIGVQVPRGWSRANASSVEYFAGGSVSWR
jgi:hypothetical protein